jgi:hypothetical protein
VQSTSSQVRYVMAKPFVWRPLAGDEDTRVVQILQSLSCDHRVQCSIRHISLKDTGNYRTVSYAWGPTYPDGSHLTEVIYCDDQPLRVTRTVYVLLNRLRADRTTWYRRLPVWIDALSIDQRDHVEKAKQVLMMSNIFEKSRHLTIWLGEPSSAQEAHLCAQLTSKFWEWEMSSDAPEVSLELEERALLYQILDRWWFRRRWIIQEVLISHTAGRTPFFRLGDSGWNWPFFVYVVEQLETSATVQRFRVLAHRIACDSYNIRGPFDQVRKPTILGSSHRAVSNTILETLHIFDHAECYDPRDKLFSLLSVGWGLSIQDSFGVDYLQSVENVYLQFAVSLLNSGGADFFEQIIASASCRPPQTGAIGDSLPSWVPDWRRSVVFANENHERSVASSFRSSTITAARFRNRVSVVRDKLWVECRIASNNLCSHDQHSSDRSKSLHGRIEQALIKSNTDSCKHPKGTFESKCEGCVSSNEALIGILHEIEALKSAQNLCLIPGCQLGIVLTARENHKRADQRSFVLSHCFMIPHGPHSDILSWPIHAWLQESDLTTIVIT